jgi:ketosteroid isomerase-like protein
MTIILTQIIIFPFASCRKVAIEEVVHQDERKVLEQALKNVFGCDLGKNFKLFNCSIAYDLNFISFSPKKRGNFGFDDVIKDSAFWGNHTFRAIRYELKDLQINYSLSGDVAWYFCYLDLVNKGKDNLTNCENIRWTGVMEKQNGRWRVVMQHYSIVSE